MLYRYLVSIKIGQIGHGDPIRFQIDAQDVSEARQLALYAFQRQHCDAALWDVYRLALTIFDVELLGIVDARKYDPLPQAPPPVRAR